MKNVILYLIVLSLAIVVVIQQIQINSLMANVNFLLSSNENAIEICDGFLELFKGLIQ